MGHLRNIYEQIDRQLMSYANVAVKTWNWTTGRTKSELASILAYGEAVFSTAYEINSPNYSFPVLSGMSLTTAILASSLWKKQEEKEISAKSKSMIDLSVEDNKKIFGMVGMMGCFGSVCTLAEPLLSLASLCLSSGCYVSRIDSLPPRKDCVRRGLEKIAEVWNNRKLQPVPVQA